MEQEVCPERPSQQHWLIQKLFSAVKYMLFGAFVLMCNKLHRYVRAQRKRVNSSSCSGDIVDVSAQEGGGREGGREGVVRTNVKGS
jgi:hypothetical protein